MDAHQVDVCVVVDIFLAALAVQLALNGLDDVGVITLTG